MFVRTWMSANITIVAPDRDVAEALRIMKESNVRRLPVVSNEKLVGIVTKRGLYLAVPNDVNPASEDVPPDLKTGVRVADVMEREVMTADLGEPLEDVAERMRANKISGLPVVHGEKVVGIITESDIFAGFAQAMGAGKGGVRISFELDPDPKALARIVQIMKAYGIQVRSLSKFESESGECETFTMRVHGDGVDKFINSLWNIGYRVVGVVREGEDVPGDEEG